MSLDVVDLVDLVDASPTHRALFDAAFATILRPSFGSDELPDGDGIRTSLNGSGATVVSIATEDGGPVGMAVTEYSTTTDIDLLGYLATRPGDRGRGVGARLLDHLAERWRRRGVALALAELHDPRAWPETTEERAVARVRFYARWGADVLDVPWVQPALQPDLHRVPHMLLSVLARAPEDTMTVPAATVRAWADEYYAFTEGVLLGDAPDDQARALAARLGASDEVAVLPLADYDRVAPLPVG